MTDNEMITILSNDVAARYSYFLCFGEEGEKPHIICTVDILDLINRQKAEIERYKRLDKEFDTFARNLCKKRLMNGNKITTFKDLQDYIKDREAEAVKEFAERLNETAVKEMVGAEK